MIYGRSNVGKSYLVSSLLLSLLVADREFLGMQPTDKTKLWKPAILWTDPGSDEEYGERIHKAIPEGVDVDVPVFHIGRTARADEWEALADHLLSEGHNFVVVDNLMGVTGDTNDAAVVATVFDGFTRLTNHGVPVVVLHHESEKGAVVNGAPPMGASTSVQKSRVWIQVRQTAKRRLRGGNTALIVQSNLLDQPQQIVAEPRQGPDYRVLQRGPWVDKSEAAESTEPKPKRSAVTQDLNAKAAAYVVEHCQGVGMNQAATRLAEEFPDRSSATWKDQLSRGGVSKLVTRTGDDKATVWELVA
ncbi:AAA domain-containing protein [Nocardia neocaledoniensis]|uniref:AAA domain-containing protein n=2 Tax=Nocardia neocaledoniensis TaxID=236511 RepID=A0A317NCG0_9NOCA|nr:AAA domain-containing protein [Nocardia neocaledoniensis]